MYYKVGFLWEINLNTVGVQPTTFSDWEMIDAVEMREGERAGKPREKITSIQTMLDIINQSQQNNT